MMQLVTPARARIGVSFEADVQDLLATLEELGGHLTSLLSLCDRKLVAMKAADVPALNQVAGEEERELQKMLRRDGQRDAVLARLAQALRLGGSTPSRLSEIAARLPEPFCTEILGKSAELRRLATNLEEKTRLAAAVAQSVQSHIRAVFAEVARAGQETVVYGRSGQHEAVTRQTWVDAVG